MNQMMLLASIDSINSSMDVSLSQATYLHLPMLKEKFTQK